VEKTARKFELRGSKAIFPTSQGFYFVPEKEPHPLLHSAKILPTCGQVQGNSSRFSFYFESVEMRNKKLPTLLPLRGDNSS
jgi:hypothetical protein